jgi:hypothetical protein
MVQDTLSTPLTLIHPCGICLETTCCSTPYKMLRLKNTSLDQDIDDDWPVSTTKHAARAFLPDLYLAAVLCLPHPCSVEHPSLGPNADVISSPLYAAHNDATIRPRWQFSRRFPDTASLPVLGNFSRTSVSRCGDVREVGLLRLQELALAQSLLVAFLIYFRYTSQTLYLHFGWRSV